MRQLLLDIFAGTEKVLAEPAPSVFIDSIGGGLVALNCFAYVSSPRSVYGARSEVLFELLRQLAAHGIPLSTPTDVRLVRGAVPPEADVAG